MFDYIEMELFLENGFYNKSVVDERFSGVLGVNGNIIRIRYSETTKILKIYGNLPYFIQGHNVWFGREETKKGINYLSELLKVDLYDAEVKILEYGVVVFTDFTMKEFINNHLQTKGYKRNIYEYETLNYIKVGNKYKLKFYDLWSNFRNSKNKISKKERQILEKSDYCKENHPMRYEIHGNPKRIVGRKVLVSDLFDEDFELKYQKFMLEEYNKLNKREKLKLKMTRFNAIDLVTVLLAEKDENYQENILNSIEKINIGIYSKNKAKVDFRKRFRNIPKEKYQYSIESAIRKAFNERNLINLK